MPNPTDPQKALVPITAGELRHFLLSEPNELQRMELLVEFYFEVLLDYGAGQRWDEDTTMSIAIDATRYYLGRLLDHENPIAANALVLPALLQKCRWLHRDHIKHETRHQHSSIDDPELTVPSANVENDEAIVTRLVIEGFLATLPPEHRNVLKHFSECRSWTEVAVALGKPRRTVRDLYVKTIFPRLKVRLKALGLFESDAEVGHE